MRTLRKVFCVLTLAILITSSAAFAAPESGSDTRVPSFASWALSLLDSIVAYILPDKNGFNPPGEIGGAVDPHGAPEKDGGEEPPGEIGGGVDPNG